MSRTERSDEFEVYPPAASTDDDARGCEEVAGHTFAEDFDDVGIGRLGRRYSRAGMARGGYLMQLGRVPYLEAWELQRSLAGAVSQGAMPDTDRPARAPAGRHARPAHRRDGELHVPEGAEVEVVETDRGGKSTFHGPGQLVCYPILDLKRHGRDVKQYVREPRGGDHPHGRAVRRRGRRGSRGSPASGSTRPPRKIASIGVHVSRWVTTHGYALNVDLDPAPFTEWITACGLEDAMFTTLARELGRPVTVDEVRPHAVAALEEVFELELEELPADDGAGLWAQPLHEQLARDEPSDWPRVGRRARRRGNAATFGPGGCRASGSPSGRAAARRPASHPRRTAPLAAHAR